MAGIRSIDSGVLSWLQGSTANHYQYVLRDLYDNDFEPDLDYPADDQESDRYYNDHDLRDFAVNPESDGYNDNYHYLNLSIYFDSV